MINTKDTKLDLTDKARIAAAMIMRSSLLLSLAPSSYLEPNTMWHLSVF